MSWSGMVETPQGWQCLVPKRAVPSSELMAGPREPRVQPQGGLDPHVASGDITSQLPRWHWAAGGTGDIQPGERIRGRLGTLGFCITN